MSLYEGSSSNRVPTFSGSTRSTEATSISAGSVGGLRTAYKDVKATRWTGFSGFKAIVRTLSEKLELEGRGNNFIAFTNVDPESFKTIETTRDSGALGYNPRFDYDPALKELLIKLPTHPHEGGHAELAFKIDKVTIKMSCEDELNRSGATKRKSERTQRSKEGDSSWTPFSRTSKGIKLPSVVIESGFSESLTELQSDAARWINMGEGFVKIVIIVSIRVSTGEILIKKWIPIEHTATRSGITLTPTKVQSLSITMRRRRPLQAPEGEYVHLGGPVTKGHFYIRGAPLIIEFSALFDRESNPRKPEERDIQIDAETLADFCCRVFSEATIPS